VDEDVHALRNKKIPLNNPPVNGRSITHPVAYEKQGVALMNSGLDDKALQAIPHLT